MNWQCKARECDFQHLYTNHRNASARYEDCPVDVTICRRCGLVALDTDGVTEEWLSAYYSTYNPFERPGALPPGHQALRESQVAWLLGELPPGHGVRSVLDVGCGAGDTLALLQQRGYSVWGIDESPAMIRNLRERHGIEGYVGSFEPARVERRYDLITCVTMLEHVLDPSAMIDKLSDALADDGYLYVEVPDAEHPRWDMVPDHLAFEHLFHFTERTLGRLLELGRFHVESVEHVENAPDSGNPERVLRLLARKTPSPRARYLGENDYERELAVLADYRAAHERYLAGFEERLREVKAKVGDEPLAIYCGGEHTASLLGRFDFSAFDVPCIFDSDAAVAGSAVAGVPVRHSSEIAATGIRHFLLSTTNHELEIYDDLKTADPASRVYGLYTQLD